MRSIGKYILLTGLILGLSAHKTKQKMTDENIEIILNWIEGIEKIPASHYKVVAKAEDLPDPPKNESLHWAGILGVGVQVRTGAPGLPNVGGCPTT